MDRKLVTTGAAVLGLALAGCGSTSTEPMTKAEFTAAAHRICAERAADLRTAMGRSKGDFQAAIRASVPALESSVKELEGLRPPAELRAAFDDVMARERQQVAIAHEYLRTGRFPQDASEHGPRLHRHEHERARMRMEDCS